MSEIIGDDMLEQFVPRGTYAEIAQVLRRRYAGLSRRITFPIPQNQADDERVAEVVHRLQSD